MLYPYIALLTYSKTEHNHTRRFRNYDCSKNQTDNKNWEFFFNFVLLFTVKKTSKLKEDHDLIQGSINLSISLRILKGPSKRFMITLYIQFNITENIVTKRWHTTHFLYFVIIMKVQSEKRKVLTEATLFQGDRINISLLCKELAYEAVLEMQLLRKLLERFRHIVDAQPNMIAIEDPALVIGDIHGQFYDLVKILSHANALRSGEWELGAKLIFLGDYVDRGINAVEVMVLLVCLKIEHPQRVFLLRGNHESRIMTNQYNFRSECCIKYSQEVYDLMMDCFDLLPLVCLVNGAYFCVHGGISDKLMDIRSINSLQRKIEIPVDGSSYCDLIWADPTSTESGELPGKTKFNEARDCSIVFGADLVRQFLAFNNLSTIVRGHEVFIEGYKTYDWPTIKSTPSLITVFSAPNYCGTCGNKGAVLKIEGNAFRLKQFRQQEPEKYKFLVKFDVFSWTLPEIMRNVKEIVLEMMQSIVENALPELKEVSSDQRLSLLIEYAISQKLVPVLPSRPSEIRQKELLTAEQERNYLFNRSHEYYAEFEKLPKHH